MLFELEGPPGLQETHNSVVQHRPVFLLRTTAVFIQCSAFRVFQVWVRGSL